MLGLTYPLRIENGNLAISDGARNTADHILSWFETFKGEMPEPDYGIPDLIGDSRNLESIKSSIQNDLKLEFPNILFNLDFQLDDSGFIQIDIDYRDLDLESSDSLTVILNA